MSRPDISCPADHAAMLAELRALEAIDTCLEAMQSLCRNAPPTFESDTLSMLRTVIGQLQDIRGDDLGLRIRELREACAAWENPGKRSKFL